MEHGNENIIFHNIVKVSNSLWFWGLKEDVLFKAECHELCADIVDLRCYQNKRTTVPLFGKIGQYKNKLIGVPLSADEILIYDCLTGIDKYVPLPKYIFEEEFVERGKFWDVVIDEKYAYFIGYWSNKILKFDLAEEKISEIIEPNTESVLSCKDVYFKKADMYGDYLIVPSCQKNIVYIIDKDSMEYQVKKFNGTNDGFSSLLIDGCNIWLSPRRSGNFVRWNPKTDRVDYLNYPEECRSIKPSYGFLEKIEDDILAFPLHAKSVLRINSKTLEVHIDSQLTEIYGNDDENDDKKIQKTGFTEFDGNELIIYSWKESCFMKYDIKTALIKKSRMKYADICYISLMKKEMKSNGYINEKEHSLDIFIQNIDELYRS